jgi:hypothetical protein
VSFDDPDPSSGTNPVDLSDTTPTLGPFHRTIRDRARDAPDFARFDPSRYPEAARVQRGGSMGGVRGLSQPLPRNTRRSRPPSLSLNVDGMIRRSLPSTSVQSPAADNVCSPPVRLESGET